jgi:FkbM family methyltransferase
LFTGDFGLYAAACGCQVFIFEVQPAMVALIQTSITLNNFSSLRVRVFQKAVSDLPSNSQLQFALSGGQTTAMNGALNVSTIRLDDVEWPLNSIIYLLKIDVEGFELNVLRSAMKLFNEKRVRHLIFEYTAWWTDRAAQQELLPFVEKTLNVKNLYALHRTAANVYGPLERKVLDEFHGDHVRRHLQIDIYATFDDSNGTPSIKAEPYNPASSFT